MTDAEQLNSALEAAWPAAARCLSPQGRFAAFPRGIPFQSAQARGAELDATIGQVTDGAGHPLTPATLARVVGDLDPEMCFLYSPMAGHPSLRAAWRARQARAAGHHELDHAPMSLPLVTHGLTQGVSLVATLFGGPQTTVLLPDPCWENYDLVFGWSGARTVRYPFFAGGRLNVEGIADALAAIDGPCIVVINLPGNPTGYTPPAADALALAEVLLAHRGPAVALIDDAYQGMLWEDGLMARSLYWELANAADPERLLPIKVDGATKELLFFPGRVGFLSHPLTGDGEAALLSKLMCAGRATVGSPPGPSQAIALAALRSPDLQRDLEDSHAVLRRRYRALREALDQVDDGLLAAQPFNSGCFAMVDLPPQLDPEATRVRLLDEASVGTVALPGTHSLRIAYCSVAEQDIPELVRRTADVVRRALP